MSHDVATLLKSTVQQLSAEKVIEMVSAEDESVFMRDIVNGSVAGSSNDCTLRFLLANDANVGDAMTIDHDATDGDSVTISQRGVYEVELVFSAAASDEVRLGISADVAAAGLNSDPAMTIAGMLIVGGGTLPASTTAFWCLKTTVRVTESEADAGKVVRFHGSDAGDGVIADAAILNNTDCFARITRVSDLIAL